MSAHARLSPSSAHRWMTCPGSVKLSEQTHGSNTVHSDSPFALEGTRAHTVAELEAAKAFELIPLAKYEERMLAWRESTPPEQHDDMLRHAAAYVDLLYGLAGNHPHSQVVLEQKVNTGVDACWGTLDSAIISPNHLHVVDYKYGMGIRVDARDNPQLKMYAIGALDLFATICAPETVCMSIHQPRLGHTSHYCTTAEELRQWRDQIAKPAATLALSDSSYFAPSESACRFCPAAGDCRARADYMTRQDFGNPDALSPGELGEILARIPDIEKWCSSVKERSLRMAYNEGVRIPGWKVVRSGGRRDITDKDRAIDTLVKAGYPMGRVSKTSLQTLATLERVVGGKQALSTILGPLLVRGDGKEALVPEQDERPGIDSLSDAQEDFKDDEVA